MTFLLWRIHHTVTEDTYLTKYSCTPLAHLEKPLLAARPHPAGQNFLPVKLLYDSLYIEKLRFLFKYRWLKMISVFDSLYLFTVLLWWKSLFQKRLCYWTLWPSAMKYSYTNQNKMLSFQEAEWIYTRFHLTADGVEPVPSLEISIYGRQLMFSTLGNCRRQTTVPTSLLHTGDET